MMNNPYYNESIWLSYKHNVLNRLGSLEDLSSEDQYDVGSVVRDYNMMCATVRIYNDLVESGASEAVLKQLDEDFKMGRFAEFDDPVNECRRVYGLEEVGEWRQ